MKKVSQDGEDAQNGLAERFLGRLPVVLPAVAGVFRFPVDEDRDQHPQEGEGRRDDEDLGNSRDAENVPDFELQQTFDADPPAADDIGDEPARDRADVDDHVENPEGQGGPLSGRFLDRAGDAGFDDGASQSDEDDARYGQKEVSGKQITRPAGQGRRDVLESGHGEIAQGDEHEGDGQGAFESELVGQGSGEDRQEVDHSPEDRAVQERGQSGFHAQGFFEENDHEGGHGVISRPFEELDGVGRPERRREFLLGRNGRGRGVGHRRLLSSVRNRSDGLGRRGL